MIEDVNDNSIFTKKLHMFLENSIFAEILNKL